MIEETPADQGNDSAQASLGFAYANGLGAAQDDAEAVRWYRLAADQGNAGAQYGLGLMYQYGRSVTEDYVAAYMWLDLAASRLTDAEGDRAVDGRDSVGSQLTASQRAEAQRLAREWAAAHPR